MGKNNDEHIEKNSLDVKVELAEMLKGGAIVTVFNPEQAKIAENAGAVAVVIQEMCPQDHKEKACVARMADLELIRKIQESVSIPIFAKCRIGHFVEAQILEALFVDFIDESEELSPADEENNIDKDAFRTPFVCGAADLGEALRRIGEGAAMIRTKGDTSTGNNISEAVGNIRTLMRQIRRLTTLDQAELMAEAKRLDAPYHLAEQVAEIGKLPVPSFGSGGVSTPADAALMMQLGVESIFVGPDVFKFEDPAHRLKAIVAAVAYYDDPEKLAKISLGSLSAMKGADIQKLTKEEFLAQRGWQ